MPQLESGSAIASSHGARRPLSARRRASSTCGRTLRGLSKEREERGAIARDALLAEAFDTAQGVDRRLAGAREIAEAVTGENRLLVDAARLRFFRAPRRERALAIAPPRAELPRR